MVVILFLGFSSGLPLLLTFGTLSAWLAVEGVDKTTIGLFALVGVPYAVKFLWSPVIDGLTLPVLTRRLGRRRGWAILIQALLLVAILLLGFSSPAAAPLATAAVALVVAFLSASQDIVIDAYRVEILADDEQGAGAAAIQLGYRGGMLAAGAGALFIADAAGWPAAYAAMAALVLVGAATVLLAREPAFSAPKPASPARRDVLADWVKAHVVAPFADFIGRPHWLAILLFILLYKFGDAVAGVMTNPFYVELGFSLSEIAGVTKVFGLATVLAGVILGGLAVSRLGILPALLVCGVLQALSNLVFCLQAAVGDDLGMLAVTIAAENLSGGMGTAAFVAYLSSLCNVAFTATQYALLSSFMAVGRTVLSSAGGWLADRTDWIAFFAMTAAAALPGLLVLLWLMRARPEAQPIPAR